MPSRKLAARGGEPDCPLGSSGSVDWAIDSVAGLSHERADANPPIALEAGLIAGDLGEDGVERPTSDHLLAALEASTSALGRVIAELMPSAAGLDAKRARLCAELESVHRTLTSVADRNQSALRRHAELVAALDSAREEAESRERALMEQQDSVLEALLTEHERQTQALEHELQVQCEYATALRRELDEKAELVETLRHQPPRPAPTPRTWPPTEVADERPDASESHRASTGSASVARLVADRDHLLASLKLLKRQRDDAQQETLDLVEQLAAANNEIEALRGQLPGVSAPPVPSSRRAEPMAPPPLPGFLREPPVRVPQARLAPARPPLVSGCAPPTPTARPSKAPTLPPAEPPSAPQDDWVQDGRAVVITAPLEEPPSRREPLREPPVAAPFRTMTRPGPAGYFNKPERPRVPPPDACGPPPSRGGAVPRSEPGAPRSDRKPPLKRKPDPTQRPLGTYSLTGTAETESLHPPNNGTGRPSGGGRP